MASLRGKSKAEASQGSLCKQSKLGQEKGQAAKTKGSEHLRGDRVSVGPVQ